MCTVPLAAAAGFGGTAALALVTAVLALVGFHAVLKGFRPGIDTCFIALLALVLTLSYALPQTSWEPPEAGDELLCLLAGLALLAACLVARPDARRVAQLTAGCGTGAAAYLLLRGENAAGRLIGLGLNPNYAGVLLALATVAAVGMAKTARNRAWLLPALVCAAAVFETRSRGAYLTVFAGLTSLLLAGRPPRQKVLIALVAFLSAVILPGTLNSQTELTGDRSSAELAANSGVRTQAALLAARVAWENPLRGIGYAAFPHIAESTADFHIYMNTHNDYLRLAAEAGAPALVLFAILLWRGLYRRCSGYDAVLRAVVVANGVALLFANTLSNLVVTVPFWISLGCLFTRTAARESPPPAPDRLRSRPLTAIGNRPRGAPCRTDQPAPCPS
ncbi:O-antigen ligase family protein [Streptomyces gilvus]|uniref:O-antigen ligase family protein n=1 Tax=Streptomyces gilvus TaxID=2920937 RepID=UPI001F0F4D6A|nr:O-antigen ligase family protein [Streptomyces sp. CME 23]MCH5671513.1 O-antigen ligase family protein [Streptomyces sp. CME 23]